jgi:hypothetical protein
LARAARRDDCATASRSLANHAKRRRTAPKRDATRAPRDRIFLGAERKIFAARASRARFVMPRLNANQSIRAPRAAPIKGRGAPSALR